MTDPSNKYSIRPHGDGYAIYRGRDLHHHGYNIGHLTEVTQITIKLIEDALNATLAQPEQTPVAWMDNDGNVCDWECPGFPIPLYTTKGISK